MSTVQNLCSRCLAALTLASVFSAAISGVTVQSGPGRTLLQANQDPNQGAWITVTRDNPNVDAIAITPVLAYPQSAYYCNITGDPRLAPGAFFPLTVQVPVGLTSTVIFANISGPIPGTEAGSNVVNSFLTQQPGSSLVRQPGQGIIQQPTSVVQQAGQPCTNPFKGCHLLDWLQPAIPKPCASCGEKSTSVVQQPGTSVVQQPGSAVIQQPRSAVTQQPGSGDIQQPGSAILQQPGAPGTPGGNFGRKLLQQPAPVEYISHNGSMGQPQLHVYDTVEGVPHISFSPTAQGQTASFTGALQVAVTTSGDGFGTPYIPYRIESRLSPDCRVVVRFQAI